MSNYSVSKTYLYKKIVMRGYSTMSDEERNSILQQHSAFYNGYATGNIPSGPQPLLQDEGPSDSQGITVNNRGEVGQYKNHLVNESVVSEEDKDWIQKVDMDKGSFTEYCGGEVTQLFLNMNSEKCKSLQEEVKEYAADDMDVSDVESAYDFESGGPEQFDDSTTDISDSYGMDIDSIMQMFGGEMSAAEYDDVDSDMNQDLDGKEKYSGEMGAYNFNSDGSMDGETYEEVDEEDVCEGCGETYEEVDEEDVCEGCGETYEDVDEDLMEDFIKQKERIVEMFDRFKKFI
jgi:predicted Fe-S protein YdhL (DUF1289 family)